MNTQLLVSRMLTSLSTSKLTTNLLVDQYLQVFGVPLKSTSNELPVVFDQTYVGSWRSVVSDSKFLNKDPRTRLLLTILEYVKFMRSQKVNPFLVTGKTNLNKVIRPVDMGVDVLRSLVKDDYLTITNYLRKTGILSYLKLSERIVQVALDKKYININLALTPIRNEPLERILYRDLNGRLYKTNCPKQLQTQIPDNTKTFRVITSTLSTSQSLWLPLTSINTFKIFARSTKDALTVRVVIPIDKDMVTTPKDFQTLTTLWRTVK